MHCLKAKAVNFENPLEKLIIKKLVGFFSPVTFTKPREQHTRLKVKIAMGRRT